MSLSTPIEEILKDDNQEEGNNTYIVSSKKSMFELGRLGSNKSLKKIVLLFLSSLVAQYVSLDNKPEFLEKINVEIIRALLVVLIYFVLDILLKTFF